MPRRAHTGRCAPIQRKRRLAVQELEARLALTTLPSGFTETLITTASNLSGPTAMEISPTGQIWVLEQGGRVKLVIPSTGNTFTALTKTVDSAGERGMLGIAFEPSYDGAGPNTDYVYLYYTVPRANNTTPSHNRVSRFTVTGAGTTSPTLGSELVIRDLPPENEDNDLTTDGDTNHNGGAIHFGPDGKLYVAVGDHNYDPPNQVDHPSQKTDTPFGKILRLNADGSNPSVVGDRNPFYTGSTTDWQGSIWAMGLRNPYTFAFQPGTGKMFINDVGEGNWEEINQGAAGANYGWASGSPLWEGFESPPPPWANYANPVMAYDHSNSLPSPAGIAITGGAFYPSGGVFGDSYAGKYFFADVGANFIRVFDPANPGSVSTPDTSTSFASSLSMSAPVDLKVDAQGNLYYLARGGASGEVYRISAADVVGRQLFYNGSAFDNNSTAINAADDNAVASDKTAYLPGTGTASFANVSSYDRGINGIMLDLLGTHGSISPNDFIFRVGTNNTPSTWGAAPSPTTISVRAGAGVGGADRVEIVWADGAIRNTWLEVIVKSNSATGLPQLPGYPDGQGDVFFFGNRVGEAGVDNTGGFLTTDANDELAARAGQGLALTPNNPLDFDRDRVVDADDQLLARGNTGLLRLIAVVSPPLAPEEGSAPVAATATAVADTSLQVWPSASSTSESSAPARLPDWLRQRLSEGGALHAGLGRLLARLDLLETPSTVARKLAGSAASRAEFPLQSLLDDLG